MIKALTIAAAIAAFAGSASAAPSQITVSLVGKDDATIHADIRHAAKLVCRDLYRGTMASFEAAGCVSKTVSATEARIKAASAGQAKAPEQLASAR